MLLVQTVEVALIDAHEQGMLVNQWTFNALVLAVRSRQLKESATL